MKKYTFLFVVIATLALTSCGSGSTTTESTDSTMAPVADTTAVVADTTAVPVEAETPVSHEAVK